MDLTPAELRLARGCIKSSLELRETFVKTFKPSVEGGVKMEAATKRNYSKFVAIEIPKLKSLLQKFGVKS